MTDAELAQQLIDTVRREVNAEAALVRDRVAYALRYMDDVERPNQHTLTHLRWILTGTYDRQVWAFAARQDEESKASARAGVCESKEEPPA